MRVAKFLGAGALGAGLAYFLDPDRGRRRRAVTKDKATAAFRRRRRDMARQARYVSGQAAGVGHKLAGGDGAVPEDDRTLEAKIRSEVLGKAPWQGCSINVQVTDGVVDLRGELQTPAEINRLERELSKFPGVARVDNHVVLPNTVNSR